MFDVPLKLNNLGHRAASVVSFGERNPKSVQGPTLSAAFFEWSSTEGHPNLPNGGLHLPFPEDGLYQFEPPRTFSACQAVTLGDALDRCLSDPNEISMGAYANWGHARAHRLKIRIRTAFIWVLADSHGEPMNLAHCGRGVGTV